MAGTGAIAPVKKVLVLLNIVLLLLPKITGNGTVEQLKTHCSF